MGDYKELMEMASSIRKLLHLKTTSISARLAALNLAITLEEFESKNRSEQVQKTVEGMLGSIMPVLPDAISQVESKRQKPPATGPVTISPLSKDDIAEMMKEDSK